MGETNCSCLVVHYDPKIECEKSYLMSERWMCEMCGSEFIRKGCHEYKVETLQTQLTEANQKLAEARKALKREQDKSTSLALALQKALEDLR